MKANKKQRVYFAHPMGIYDTELEKKYLRLLRDLFPDSEIVNPNSVQHSKAGGGRMQYYLNLVSKTCDAVVAVKHYDRWGAGVWAELDTASKSGLDTFELTPDGKLMKASFKKSKPMTVFETARKNSEAQENEYL